MPNAPLDGRIWLPIKRGLLSGSTPCKMYMHVCRLTTHEGQWPLIKDPQTESRHYEQRKDGRNDKNWYNTSLSNIACCGKEEEEASAVRSVHVAARTRRSSPLSLCLVSSPPAMFFF